ncbi:MAG: WD40 repeat domain-containing serine/threonine-protein kinase [Planctomycetota bacterium]
MTGSSELHGPDSEVFDFVSLFLADRAEGRELPLEEYLRRFPGLEDAIRTEHRRITVEDAEPAADERGGLRQIGPYAILSTLGRGGQGSVLLAEDTRLRRRVALKVLAPHLDFVSTDRLQRFRREAAILSQLDHPAICTVFEAESFDGISCLAMRYIEGETLAAVIRHRRDTGALPRTRAEIHRDLAWIETAAGALHEAHESGIVHRDVKPGNVMITPQGEPVLLDFGLARDQNRSDLSVTRTGELLGTLAYMAPELLGDHAARADRRSDVYALGVTLYECLTGALPFRADSQTALWRSIEQGDVVAPRNHNAAIPAELAAVLHTAMAKSPTHRYATALEFAEDLARVRRREPIRARAVPPHVRVLRYAQRHPTTSLGILAAFLLITILAVSLQRVYREERAASALNRALGARASDEGAAAALADLCSAAGATPRADLRSALVQVLDACHLDWWFPRTPLLVAHTDPEPSVDPGENLIAIGDSSGSLELRSTRDGHRLARRRAHAFPIHAVAFADADHVLTAAPDGVHVHSADALQDVATVRTKDSLAEICDCEAIGIDPVDGGVLLGGPGVVHSLDRTRWIAKLAFALTPRAPVRRFEFSADGSRLVVLGKDGGEDADANNLIWLVDPRAGKVLHGIQVEQEEVLFCTFDPTSSVLALAHNGGMVEVRDADTFEVLFHCDAGQEVNWCGFDPTGSVLLIPSDGSTELWQWRDRPAAPFRRLPNPSARTIGAAAFDGSHHMLASVHRDGTVLIRSTDDWRILRQFKQRMINVRFLRWLAATGDLLTADNEKVSSWLAGNRPHAPEYFGHRDAITGIAVDADDVHFATGSLDGTARLWSIDGATPAVVADLHGTPVRHLCLDRAALIVTGDDGVLHLFAREDGHALGALSAHQGPIEALLPLPTVDRVVSIGVDGACKVWDIAGRRCVRALSTGEAPLRSIAAHPTRPWLALGGADTFVTVWDWALDRVVMRKPAIGVTVDWHTNPFFQVRGIAFDAPRDRVIASLVNVRLSEFDLRNGSMTTIDEQRFGGGTCSAPDGSVLCADYSFGCLTLLRDGRARHLTVDGADPHSNRIASVRVAPGAELALSAARDGLLVLWDLTRGEAVQSVRTGTPLLAAEFTADGRFVITGQSDGTVKMWPTDPMRSAQRYLARRDPDHAQGR